MDDIVFEAIPALGDAWLHASQRTVEVFGDNSGNAPLIRLALYVACTYYMNYKQTVMDCASDRRAMLVVKRNCTGVGMHLAKKRLEGRRILITGAASGMGKSVAIRFAEEGASLLLLDLNSDGLNAVTTAVGGVAIKTDISSDDEVRAAISDGVRTLGGLDGVVNAAGILPLAPVMDTDLETWRRVLEVNLLGPVRVCRHAVPELLKNREATIVNFASTVAIRPFPNFAAYSASKAALLSLTKSLAMELAPTIRVNAIGPGPIRTPMNEAMWAAHPDQGEAVSASFVALARVGEPREVANVALFLTGNESSFVNGEILLVDGGGTYA